MLNWQDLHRNRFLQKNLEIKTVPASTSIVLGVLYIFFSARRARVPLFFTSARGVSGIFSEFGVSVDAVGHGARKSWRDQKSHHAGYAFGDPVAPGPLQTIA